MDRPLRIGTRASLLARTQTGLIARMLEASEPVEIVHITTTGDRVQDRPLHDIGGKGLFTKELELALLDGRIDVAVHSMKDVPVTMPLVDVSTLTIAAVPEREDPRDVLVSRAAGSIAEMPRNARVGTGSLRRREQLLAVRPDLRVEGVRGNIDTRLRKLDEGAFDAIILAAAGLRRAGMFDPAFMSVIDPDQMVPAAGQGALAVQCRSGDARALGRVAVLDDEVTRQCVELERRVVQQMACDCHSPIGVLARKDGSNLSIVAAWYDGDGVKKVTHLDQWTNVQSVSNTIASRLSDVSL